MCLPLKRTIGVLEEEELREELRRFETDRLVLHLSDADELRQYVLHHLVRNIRQLDQQLRPVLLQLGLLGHVVVGRADGGRQAALEEGVDRRAHLLLVALQEGLRQLVRRRPLGPPLGDGAKGPDGVWRRSFSSGTNVSFASLANGTAGNGTIMWADGHTQRGFPTNQTELLEA